MQVKFNTISEFIEKCNNDTRIKGPYMILAQTMLFKLRVFTVCVSS